jgi:hypothetical protein
MRLSNFAQDALLSHVYRLEDIESDERTTFEAQLLELAIKFDRERHGNTVARSGYDRCTCGNKYFEQDKCIDCNKHVTEIPKCPAEGCTEICGGKHCADHEKD